MEVFSRDNFSEEAIFELHGSLKDWKKFRGSLIWQDFKRILEYRKNTELSKLTDKHSDETELRFCQGSLSQINDFILMADEVVLMLQDAEDLKNETRKEKEGKQNGKY